MHVEPANCFVGSGVYNLHAGELKKIREETYYSWEEWNNIR
ncbi:MAG: hypothetical protein DA408_16805 [Bacteroidetes bacterium]|nr:MAG: hypothetical protein DA408_16805 [Bacteroidota bacterium]